MKKDTLLNLVKMKFGIDDNTAAAFIMAGNVLVNERVSTKRGILIDKNSDIRMKEQKEYVSRGAYKLLDAYESFNLDFKDKICMDAGSSTGGFTQVLLLKGAKKVYAIDCGTNQLDFSLRKNPKVEVFENTNIKNIKQNDIDEKPDVIVMDLSFTSSAGHVIQLKKEFDPAEMVILLKPQFEYDGLKPVLGLSKDFDGIVKDDTERKKIIEYVLDEFKNNGLFIAGCRECSVKGTKGNIEYLVYIRDPDD